MSELIKIVLAKPEWSAKMKDPAIVQKWREEIVAQGISVPVFECALELLNSYDRTSNTTYEGEDTFNWDISLGVDISELDWKCECHCACCKDGYNYAPGEGDGTNEDDDYLNDDQKKRREMICECTDSKRVALFQKYVDQYVFSSTFEDADLKSTFTYEVASFERSLPSIDYHPGKWKSASPSYNEAPQQSPSRNFVIGNSMTWLIPFDLFASLYLMNATFPTSQVQTTS